MILRLHKKTNYSISGQDLLVSFTFVISFCKIINIQTIRKISKCNNIMPLGIDRVTAPDSKALEIFYNKYETIKVSPKNESEFIKDLLEINPNIEVVF
ncbi:PH domain-containing protein [Capnocytophaga canimorsus]|uniref:PH domain-containing protein n=1 Tax=Capnocytophaga canimorsus TaxID=28188 RepID=UPI0038583082